MADHDDGGARRAILDATRELLEEPGATDVGLARIAARAGYSRQAIYRHFGSRAGLLKATLADIDEQAGAEAAVARIRTAGDPEAELEALVAWWAGYVAGFIGVARSVYAGRTSDTALAAAWNDRMEALMDLCRLVVTDCARQSALRSALSRPAATELLWGLLSIPLWDQLRIDRGWSRAQYTRRLTLTVRAALLGA